MAVALAMNACPRPVMRALRVVSLLVTLLITNETLVPVSTVLLCFHSSGLGTLASVVFVKSIAL